MNKNKKILISISLEDYENLINHNIPPPEHKKIKISGKLNKVSNKNKETINIDKEMKKVLDDVDELLEKD